MSSHLKPRLDTLLVDLGLAPSRSRAQGLIMAGAVQVDGRVVSKAGTRVERNCRVELASDPNPYVSRGGLKLAAALDAFAVDPHGRVAIDVGASTGGFTDCLLQRGARRVYAVDVGYGQLAWKLRTDDRVVVMERTNARHLAPDALPERCSLAVFDCSFISLAKVVPAVLALLEPSADLIALVKPQFEAQPNRVGKGGVVRDSATRAEVIDDTVADLVALGLTERGRLDSPVAGPKGNVECLAWFQVADSTRE